jgi:hypothetical protein
MACKPAALCLCILSHTVPVVTLYCSLRLVALDGFTMGVKVGSQNHRLSLTDAGPRFGPAGLEAADNPLDLRLRCIKVSTWDRTVQYNA